MDLLGTWGKRAQDLLGGVRTSLLGEDLPPAEKRAATVGTMGPGIATQMQGLDTAQRGALATGGVRGLLGDPDVQRQATDVASNLDFTGTFGGRRAKTADLGALAKAEELAKSGTDPADIWGQTGWFRGVDDQWRHEIDDSRAKLDVLPLAQQKAGAKDWVWTEDVLKHPDLYEAYPAAKDISIRASPAESRYRGSYTAASPGGHPSIVLRSADTPAMRSTALHETQHAVQEMEGFAQGAGSADQVAQQFYNDINRKLTSLARRADKATGEEKARLMAEGERLLMEKLSAKPHDLYRRQAAETEARAVQARRDLLPEQRRVRPPWLDYDVPPEQQIVRGVR